MRAQLRHVAREAVDVVHVEGDAGFLRGGEPDRVPLLGGHVVASGTLAPGRYLAIGGSLATGKLDGIATTEPSFGLPATWVAEPDRALDKLPVFVDQRDQRHGRVEQALGQAIAQPLAAAEAKGLLERDFERVWPSARGFDFLSDLQALFLTD